MNLGWAVLIIIASTGLVVGAMLAVRRRAPDGSYFADGDRAAGAFGVLATGFSVLLGLIIFLAFTSYDVLAVVLFAACLFFAGLSTRLPTLRGQAVVLSLGCLLFVGTVIWVATLPATVSI
jgi:hypothetical protein